MSRKEQALVEAAELVLVRYCYMELSRDPLWDDLEAALQPYREDCKRCGMVKTPPGHHEVAPYFCDFPAEGAR